MLLAALSRLELGLGNLYALVAHRFCRSEIFQTVVCGDIPAFFIVTALSKGRVGQKRLGNVFLLGHTDGKRLLLKVLPGVQRPAGARAMTRETAAPAKATA